MPNPTREELRDGEPCKHPGCLAHVSHPCEGCGRIAGRRENLRQAAEESIAGYMALEYPPTGLAPREVQFARALLAALEREGDVKAISSRTISLLKEKPITDRTYYEQMALEACEQLDAAIKAAEEGRG